MRVGGAQVLVKGLFEAQKDNQDIFLYVLDFRKPSENIDVQHKNVFISNPNIKFLPLTFFISLFAFKNFAKHKNPDVIHCHLFASQIFGWLIKLLWIRNVSLVFHEHGQIFRNDFWHVLFLKQAQKKVSLFLAVSKATKNKLIEFAKIDNNKIIVLYNFVDLGRFNRENARINIQKEREKLGVDKGEFVIGFVGRLIPRKGWRVFIEAANSLLKENSNFKFIIAGDGPDKKGMLNLIDRYKLESKILCLGNVLNMVWFYSLLDLFIIPSHWEPMGLTEIEAQALGIPVISSDAPALNEIIVDYENGLLFESKNYESLVEKIKMICANEKLKKRLMENALVSVKKYSLMNYVSRLNDIYVSYEYKS